MSGFAFPSKGVGSPATVTSFFGRVPDKYTVALPGSLVSGGSAYNVSNNVPGNYVNVWSLYNQNQLGGSNVPTVSLGGTMTAPDGTTANSQKIVESSGVAMIHMVTSLFVTSAWPGQYKWRIAVFANATGAGRTRFALYMGNGFFDPDGSFYGSRAGCKTVFDVAGNQIGVANTAFGTPTNAYVPGPTEIVDFGGGWRRCTMDVLLGTGSNLGCFEHAILLDNASGIAAESTHYAGDGVSGLFFWKTSSLPPGCWALNTQKFFDDFTSFAGWDLAETNGPGFNFYPSNKLPNFPAWVATDVTKIEIVSGTLLHLMPGNPGTNVAVTAAATTKGAYSGDISTLRGNYWQGSMLIETAMAWSVSVPWSGDGSAYVLDASAEAVVEPSPRLIMDCEHDCSIAQANPLNALIYTDLVTLNRTQVFGPGPTYIGWPIWYSVFNYQTTGPFNNVTRTSYLGVGYSSLVNNNLNNIPASTVGTDWATFSFGTMPNPNFYDVTNITPGSIPRYAYLWITALGNDCGHALWFFNEMHCAQTPGQNNVNSHFPYQSSGPYAGSGGSSWCAADRLHYPIYFGGVPNTYWDYFRVTQ